MKLSLLLLFSAVVAIASGEEQPRGAVKRSLAGEGRGGEGRAAKDNEELQRRRRQRAINDMRRRTLARGE